MGTISHFPSSRNVFAKLLSGYKFLTEKFCAGFHFSVSEQKGISGIDFLARGAQISWTDSDSHQDDEVAQLSEENFKIYTLSNLSKSLSIPDWQAGRSLFTRKYVGRGDISEKIIDIDAELCKPWNKIACFEKETRLETWQYFMTRHFEIRFQKEAGGQHCQIWDSISHCEMSPKQSMGWEQYPQWEPLFSHLRVFLPGLKNNWDKCIQRSRAQTMLGKPENSLASPLCFRPLQRDLTTAKVAWSNLIRTILKRLNNFCGFDWVPPLL